MYGRYMLYFAGGSPYAEGGGLYALGLIHANHGANITDYLLTRLKDATNEVRYMSICMCK